MPGIGRAQTSSSPNAEPVQPATAARETAVPGLSVIVTRPEIDQAALRETGAQLADVDFDLA
jgi:hypothetical protein